MFGPRGPAGWWGKKAEYTVKNAIGQVRVGDLQVLRGERAEPEVLRAIWWHHHVHWQIEVDIRIREKSFQRWRDFDDRFVLQLISQVRADRHSLDARTGLLRLIGCIADTSIGAYVVELP
jgi:hypothetical protein